MPTRICMEPRCPAVAAYRGRCQRHSRLRERTINRAGQKIYRRKRWRNTRERVLSEQPICVECKDALAEHVHHIVDLADGGDPWARENLAGLCASCHSKITRANQRTG
jgi:5-methylcytosine-specific restriction endonuclease McrA